VQLVAAHIIKSRKHAIDRLTQDGDVAGWLWKELVQSEQHMPFEHTHVLQAFAGQLTQVLVGPDKENRIDRIHLQDRVFPLDQPIERSSGGFWNMKEDDRLVGRRFLRSLLFSLYFARSCHHG
jgi:hypothetical protein